MDGDGDTVWTFRWDPPEDVGEARLTSKDIVVSSSVALSFEKTCDDIEKELCRDEHKLVCACCIEIGCKACRFAVGFHHCQNSERERNHLVWHKGTLHASDLDIQRVMYNLYRKGLPRETLDEKAQEYVDANLISKEMAHKICRVIEAQRECGRIKCCIEIGIK